MFSPILRLTFPEKHTNDLQFRRGVDSGVVESLYNKAQAQCQRRHLLAAVVSVLAAAAQLSGFRPPTVKAGLIQVITGKQAINVSLDFLNHFRFAFRLKSPHRRVDSNNGVLLLLQLGQNTGKVR